MAAYSPIWITGSIVAAFAGPAVRIAKCLRPVQSIMTRVKAAVGVSTKVDASSVAENHVKELQGQLADFLTSGTISIAFTAWAPVIGIVFELQVLFTLFSISLTKVLLDPYDDPSSSSAATRRFTYVLVESITVQIPLFTFQILTVFCTWCAMFFVQFDLGLSLGPLVLICLAIMAHISVVLLDDVYPGFKRPEVLYETHQMQGNVKAEVNPIAAKPERMTPNQRLATRSHSDSTNTSSISNESKCAPEVLWRPEVVNV